MSFQLLPHDRVVLEKLWTSTTAVAAIRNFEATRHQLSLLDDADKPDKRTTVFVSSADLVWAWLAEDFMHFTTEAIPPDLAALWVEHGTEIARDYIESFETTDPPQVAMIDADGGLRF